MPSPAMQDAIDALRDRQQAGIGQAPPTLTERRAAFTPGDRLHLVPGDVQVTDVTAGGVPAHWLTAPGADPGRVLLFLHGGGYELGPVGSDGELAARLGRASRMRVLFPQYRLAPEGRRGGVARGRGTDVPGGGPDQLGGLHDRARRSGSDLHPRHAPPARRRLPGRG